MVGVELYLSGDSLLVSYPSIKKKCQGLKLHSEITFTKMYGFENSQYFCNLDIITLKFRNIMFLQNVPNKSNSCLEKIMTLNPIEWLQRNQVTSIEWLQRNQVTSIEWFQRNQVTSIEWLQRNQVTSIEWLQRNRYVN